MIPRGSKFFFKRLSVKSSGDKARQPREFLKFSEDCDGMQIAKCDPDCLDMHD